MSKWDISDAFHRCPLRATHIGAFTYVVPPLPSDTTILLCIDLVLPMGWVNSPDMFCAASETVADIPAGCALDTFGDRIRISCLASVDQDNCKPRLICDSTAAPNGITLCLWR